MTPAALVAALSGDVENFVVASTPGGIEAQEKRGQIEQSLDETLPVDGTSTEAQRKEFEALGFVFKMDRAAAQSQGRNELFVPVAFPKDWRKKPTEHSMWTDILDGEGNKRGSIFYKAAFYDRSAHVHLENPQPKDTATA
jgi:hypothetical protein